GSLLEALPEPPNPKTPPDACNADNRESPQLHGLFAEAHPQYRRSPTTQPHVLRSSRNATNQDARAHREAAALQHRRSPRRLTLLPTGHNLQSISRGRRLAARHAHRPLHNDRRSVPHAPLSLTPEPALA